MTEYKVTLTGEAREVYIVEAESADEAMARWETGWLESTTCFGMDVDSVEEEDA